MAITGYRILRKIRQGGMSTVYLAIQKSVDREVALKVMSPSLTVDPSFGSRFYREAKIVGQLSHPNIVSIYDVGSYKQYNYIAMDYLPGAPLQDQLKQGVSVSQALKITSEIAAALDYAHSHGYIHRDVKPDNILFRDDGGAVLCDFGIAKSLKGKVNMTNVGSVLGTPHYMSPEQVQGKNVDGRADLYGLGAVLYEMLSGQVLFPGDDPIAIAVKHVSAPIPKLPTDQRKFQPLINRLLAKKPSARYQTGKELIQAITELQSPYVGRTPSYLTNTHSTKIHVMGLIRALGSMLASTLGLSIRHAVLGKKAFDGNAVLLTQRELKEIDDFILDGKSIEQDAPTQTDTPPLIAPKRTPSQNNPSLFRWIYWPLALVSLAAGGFIYLDLKYPKQTQEVDPQTKEVELQVVKQSQPISQTSEEPVIQPKSPPDSEINSLPDIQQNEPELDKYSLTIFPTPEDARVRILNIKPTYKPEINLVSGIYHIEVSAKDYQTSRFWLQVSNQPVNHVVELKPTRKLLPVGTIVVDKLADGSDSVPMIVLSSDKQTSLPSPIAMSQYEVTFDQYDEFATLTQRPLPKDYNWGRGSRPVVGISYKDAESFAQWVSEQTGHSYRLPTQLEWEYAAKGVAGSRFWWGDNKLDNNANCRRGCESKWSKFFSSSTAPIGSYPSNHEDLYDMVGNVAEWLNGCILWVDEAKTQCSRRLIAGGSHLDAAKKISNSTVNVAPENKQSNAIGMRLVLDL